MITVIQLHTPPLVTIALSLFTGIPSLLIPVLVGTSSITFGINRTMSILAVLGFVAFVLSIYYVVSPQKYES